VLSGSPAEIADGIRSFRDVGYTQVELMFSPGTPETLEALAPVIELVRAEGRGPGE
jgi:alkanesulfonate monooxygenase SsuD/methylene tetrahydromethanopterin reductase-like flavin-dependent oxidoreductase (luciferase family)